MGKLTLSAEERVIRRAKQAAAARGISVSAMFSQYVESLTVPANDSMTDETPLRDRLPPLTRRATGLVKLPADRDDRALIDEALADRYRKS